MTSGSTTRPSTPSATTGSTTSAAAGRCPRCASAGSRTACCRSSPPTRRGSPGARVRRDAAWCPSSTPAVGACGTTPSASVATVLNTAARRRAADDPRHRRRAARAARPHRGLARPDVHDGRRRSTCRTPRPARRGSRSRRRSLLLVRRRPTTRSRTPSWSARRPGRWRCRWSHESDNAFVANLLEVVPRPAAAKSVLQVLLAHAREVEADSRDRLVPRRAGPAVAARRSTRARADVDRELVAGRPRSRAAQGRSTTAWSSTRPDTSTSRSAGSTLGAVADRHPVAVAGPADRCPADRRGRAANRAAAQRDRDAAGR